MSGRVHLYISEVPLRAGQNVIAKCGDIVNRAQVIYAWDETPVNTDLQLPSLSKQCTECWRLAKTHKRKGYTYAVVGSFR